MRFLASCDRLKVRLERNFLMAYFRALAFDVGLSLKGDYAFVQIRLGEL